MGWPPAAAMASWYSSVTVVRSRGTVPGLVKSGEIKMIGLAILSSAPHQIKNLRRDAV